MNLFPAARSAVRALLLACLLAGGGVSSRAAVVLDWNSATWTAGSLSNSYDLNADTVTDITLTVTKRGNGNNVYAIDPTTGAQTPVINQSITGGLSQNSLMIAGNLHTLTDLTVQLSFTAGNQLGTNVSFTIFDIDVTTNSDIISEIYGLAPDGITHIAATITNVGPTITQTGSGLTSVLTGTGAAANNSSDGNVTISFGSAVLTDVFFVFSNNAGAPFYQDIGMSNINFTPVPEINPAIASVGSCLVAAGMLMLVHRRRKAKTSGSDSTGS
jgi:hypothetical protein